MTNEIDLLNEICSDCFYKPITHDRVSKGEFATLNNQNINKWFDKYNKYGGVGSKKMKQILNQQIKLGNLKISIEKEYNLYSKFYRY